MNSIIINNITYSVNIFFENRKTYRASIGKKAINIRIPKFQPKTRQNKQINKLLNWATKRIKKDPESFMRIESKKYENGSKINILNKEYFLTINYKNKKTGSSKIMNNNIIISLPLNLTEKETSKLVSSLLSRCIGVEQLPWLETVLNDLNDKYFKKKIGKIRFKYNKSNWGSCSPKNNVNINTRLLLAPEPVLKYVCIHELAHLIVRNHSKKFWAIIEKVMPDYKEKQNWLKKNRNKCWF